MPLRAGQLNERVTFQESTDTRDGGGGVTLAWANLATAPTVWASVRIVSGGEQVEARQTVAGRRYEVTIRRRTDLTSAMRVVRGSDSLAILAIDDSREHPDAIVLTCEDVLT